MRLGHAENTLAQISRGAIFEEKIPVVRQFARHREFVTLVQHVYNRCQLEWGVAPSFSALVAYEMSFAGVAVKALYPFAGEQSVRVFRAEVGLAADDSSAFALFPASRSYRGYLRRWMKRV